jgi:S1-C subfamily serine protease
MTRLLMAGPLMAGGLAWGLACGSAFGQTSAATSDLAAQNSVKLMAVIAALPAGTPWLSLGTGAFCAYSPTVQTWTGGRVPQALPPYSAAFKKELEQAGYKVVTPGEDNLFDSEMGAADYEAAGVITDEHIDGCVNNGAIFAGGNLGDVRGDSSMTMDWQAYSRLKKQVVAHVTTTGKAHRETSIPGGEQRLLVDSFASNVAQLAANADFRAALNAPKATGIQTPGEQSKIVLGGSLKAPPRKIADAVGDVVTIVNDIGSGSGVLVSGDGYVLTNAHVVGDDKSARVRWSDGIETLGEVVRLSKNRDVAIIKTNPRDRMPLAIKRGSVTPGQRVYAIGSPRGKDFQGTVTSGVVSADRVFDGLRFIQSDTTVSPGSSGGPLLDETGSVIGLTDLGVQNDGPAGLNLFIPIGDAMDFLSLEQE